LPSAQVPLLPSKGLVAATANNAGKLNSSNAIAIVSSKASSKAKVKIKLSVVNAASRANLCVASAAVKANNKVRLSVVKVAVGVSKIRPNKASAVNAAASSAQTASKC
jgi:hypothetical protein